MNIEKIKKIKKKKSTYTINENILEDFNKITDENNINKSVFVEESMKTLIKKLKIF